MTLLQNLIPTLARAASPSSSAADGAEATLKPQFSVQENSDGYHLTVLVPGVARDGVEITAENDQFRVQARRAFQVPSGWRPVYGEIPTADYELVLTCGENVDASRARAELTDGVLRITLPKSEALKPRKIAVA